MQPTITHVTISHTLLPLGMWGCINAHVSIEVGVRNCAVSALNIQRILYPIPFRLGRTANLVRNSVRALWVFHNSIKLPAGPGRCRLHTKNA